MFSTLVLGQAVSCVRRGVTWARTFCLARGPLSSLPHREKFGRPVRLASNHCHEKESPLLAHEKRIPVESGLGYLAFFERASDCESDAPSARNLSSRLRANASLPRTRFGKPCFCQNRARPRPSRRLRASMADRGSARENGMLEIRLQSTPS